MQILRFSSAPNLTHPPRKPPTWMATVRLPFQLFGAWFSWPSCWNWSSALCLLGCTVAVPWTGRMPRFGTVAESKLKRRHGGSAKLPGQLVPTAVVCLCFLADTISTLNLKRPSFMMQFPWLGDVETDLSFRQCSEFSTELPRFCTSAVNTGRLGGRAPPLCVCVMCQVFKPKPP